MTKIGKSYVGVFLLLGVSLAATAKDSEKDVTATHVILRTSELIMTLAPGEDGDVSSVCLTGETVVGGGPNEIPAQVSIVYSTVLFDGFHSGWQVEWRNNGAEPVTVAASTSALCVKGTMTPG